MSGFANLFLNKMSADIILTFAFRNLHTLFDSGNRYLPTSVAIFRNVLLLLSWSLCLGK